jgi:hypothetical protein
METNISASYEEDISFLANTPNTAIDNPPASAISTVATSTEAEQPELDVIDLFADGGTDEDSGTSCKRTTANSITGDSSALPNAKRPRFSGRQSMNTSRRPSTLKVHHGNFTAFQSKIKKIDPHVELVYQQPLYVRCSSCSSEVRMRSLYDTKNFKTHQKSKKCTNTQAKPKPTFQRSLYSYLGPTQKITPSNTARASLVPLTLLCPGITAKLNPKIGLYLRRSGAAGGGAPSRSTIAKTLFGPDVSLWKRLDGKRRKVVLRMERKLYKWMNYRHLGAVYSTACEGEVMVSGIDVEPQPCRICQSLLHLHTFQVQLNRPMPTEKNMKYVPKIYRDEALGSLYLKIKGVRELVEEVCSNRKTNMLSLTLDRMMASPTGSNLRSV